MRNLAAFLLALLIAAPAHPAGAQEAAAAAAQPVIAPAPAWVERLPLPAPNPALADRPFQTLLAATQSLYGPERNEHYSDLAFTVQNSQGLQTLGNIVLPWQPENSELIVHKVEIVRGGTVIDLLAGGQRFIVLRRENNLESAMLDGMLTAVMQPEGLAVGDTLHLAFTVRRRPGVLPLRGENLFVIQPGAPVRRYFVRQIWPVATPMRWRATGAFAPGRTRRTALGTELIVDLADVDSPEPPSGIPARFYFPGILQVSQFADWSDIGAMVAPHYARAAELSATSPLRARIAQIAAASPDPRVRTMAALRLVQDEVRYFALVMGDGNYLPATAEQSWSRRFADCKGKVVLLIALLRELGIEAEPVLVHSALGDGLGERLPQMSLFNHLIVRARIGGRSYWLDGTRTGDRSLEDLASSPFGWGLPIRASGSALERLPMTPPAQPSFESLLTYDASGGLAEKVPVRIERIYRGDLARQFHAALSQAGRTEFLRRMREAQGALSGEDAEVTSFDFRDDEANGSFTFLIEGKMRMAWARAAGQMAQRFRFDNELITWEIESDRPAGPYRETPFSFPMPAYLAQTETVILPNNGQGYSIDGQDLRRTVAGVEFSRGLSLANGRATARSEFRRIEREVSAADIRQARPLLTTIGDDGAYLRAPVGTMPARASAPAVAPNDAEALLRSGHDNLERGRLRAALADFDRAIALAPAFAGAHAGRAHALAMMDRLDEADASLATAIRLEENDAYVQESLAFLRLGRGRLEEAVTAYDRTLALRPDNPNARGSRALAYARLGRMDAALADLDSIIAADPHNAFALAERARILVFQRHETEGLAAMERALAADPGDYMLVAERADMLAQFGHREEAAAAYAAALAMLRTAIPDAEAAREQVMGLLSRAGRTAEAMAIADAELRRFPGVVPMLAARCWIRLEANLELQQALRDCSQALEAEPGHPLASAGLARLYLRLERWADAEREFSALLAGSPRSEANTLYGRGIARIRAGRREEGERDIAAARRLRYDVAWEYGRLGLDLPPVPVTAAAPAVPVPAPH